VKPFSIIIQNRCTCKSSLRHQLLQPAQFPLAEPVVMVRQWIIDLIVGSIAPIRTDAVVPLELMNGVKIHGIQRPAMNMC
jgi:hypothetical protein